MDTSSFHQFITKVLPERLLEYVIVLILSLIIYYILDRYFRVHPKLSIEFARGPDGDWSSGGSSIHDQIEMKWNRQFIFKSITKHDSLDVQIIWPDNKNPYNFKIPEHTIIRGYERYSISFVVKNSFPHDQVIASGNTRESLLPPELKTIKFVVSYRNEKGKTFFTLFKFNSGKPPENLFYRFKPRL